MTRYSRRIIERRSASGEKARFLSRSWTETRASMESRRIRQRGPHDGSKTPGNFAAACRRVVWSLRPLVDPGPQQTDLSGGQRISFGGHGDVGVEMRDRHDEQAVGTLTGHDHPAALPPLECRRPSVEPQIGHLLASGRGT